MRQGGKKEIGGERETHFDGSIWIIAAECLT